MANPIESIHSAGHSARPVAATLRGHRGASSAGDLAQSTTLRGHLGASSADGVAPSTGARLGRLPSPTGANSGTPGAGWSARLRDAADTLAWVAGVNLLWVAFTLAGLVVLGAAPATMAAAIVARRRLRGESEPLVRAFASAWWAEVIPANRLLLPIVAVDGLLVANWVYYSQQDGDVATITAIASVVGMVLSLAVGAVVVTMRAHYDLAAGPYRTALRWIALNPGSLLLLAVTATLIGAVTAFVPGLLPFLSIGTWLTVSTALCLSFFAHNDQLVAARHEHPDLSDAGARD